MFIHERIHTLAQKNSYILCTYILFTKSIHAFPQTILLIVYHRLLTYFVMIIDHYHTNVKQ